jgi:sterol desaturase/sphingolipid hydroxylase (fatty acid hydroxylase superfamily)
MDMYLRGFLVDIARLAIWLAILTLIFVPLERLFALHPARIWRRAVLTDVGFYFLNSLVPNLLMIAPVAVLAWGLRRVMPDAYLQAVAHLPFWARLPLVLVVGEIGFYWGHRWSHEIPFLWRFHAIHHAPEHVDWLVNTRAHPVDMVFTRLCGLVPLYVLGLAQVSRGTDLAPVLVVLIGTVWGFFIHANMRWRFGWLETLIATPAFHHWHHTNDANRDRNYAALFPWLDRLFGTYHLPKAWPPNYGIDAPLPNGMAAQLLHPLRPARAEAAAVGASREPLAESSL